MKDLITTVASLLILMMFILQFSVNQATHTRIFQADMAVESFRDVLKEEGGLSPVNQSEIRNALSEICGCSSEDVIVECSQKAEAPVPQGMLIKYRINFPLKNLIAMGGALQIPPEDNMVWSKQEGWVMSRYEEPDSDPGNCTSHDDGNVL